MNNSTIVTGIWDLNRDGLTPGWSRSFDHYIESFKKLLNCKNLNLAIFIDPSLEDLIWSIRDKSNTAVYFHKKEDFGGNFFPFFDNVQKIRNDPQWLNQVGWLAESTQAKLEFYNPMVMSKMFLLHNAKAFNPFNSDYYWWIDGGITNTVHPGYFSHDKVIDTIEESIKKFLFVCFPYETTSEIHGFTIDGMKKYCKSDNVNRVARGGFFGGHKDYISQANETYYSILDNSLKNGLMGTEESIFTIMTYLEPETYDVEFIEDNGLISTFFENVKNNNLKSQKQIRIAKNNDVILYLNTFNAPLQLKMLLESFNQYDISFLNKTNKYLINNSTDPVHDELYNELALQYNLIQIKQGNMGVCGARQFAAEHFADLKAKYMFFFEDDMLLDLSLSASCPFGFSKHTDNLFDRLTRLMDLEEYDFIKCSFSEFFGHNGDQWSWHNLPQNARQEYFADLTHRPKTVFNNIKTNRGLPYADGEIYYSNWPHIISQEGNKKIFLDTKWAHPYEQTWMSHTYSLTKQDLVKPAILLISPITHNRIYFYEGKDRKES